MRLEDLTLDILKQEYLNPENKKQIPDYSKLFSHWALNYISKTWGVDDEKACEVYKSFLEYKPQLLTVEVAKKLTGRVIEAWLTGDSDYYIIEVGGLGFDHETNDVVLLDGECRETEIRTLRKIGKANIFCNRYREWYFCDHITV